MTKFRKLGRPTGHRMSMLRTMVSQLVKHERIETTVAKNRKRLQLWLNFGSVAFVFAKEIRRLADNMVQLGKDVGKWGSKKKQNCKCVRYDVNGECKVFLVATRDIAKGERLYYDYNGYEHAYPTHNFV